MRTENIKKYILGIVLIATAPLAVAASTALNCNGCTELQLLARAQQMGRGYHYIYNLPGNAIHLFYTQCEPSGVGGTACYADEQGVSSDVENVFSQYSALYAKNGNSEHFSEQFSVDLPSGSPVGRDGKPQDNGSINAYDTLVAGWLENKVVDYLNNPMSWTGAQAAAIQTAQIAKSDIINFSGASLVVTAVLNDGSRRTYKYDTNSNTFTPIADTARDAHGNTIPESTPKAGSEYIFNGGKDGNSGPGYDLHNLFWELEHTPPTDPTCAEENWDGERLTCNVRR